MINTAWTSHKTSDSRTPSSFPHAFVTKHPEYESIVCPNYKSKTVVPCEFNVQQSTHPPAVITPLNYSRVLIHYNPVKASLRTLPQQVRKAKNASIAELRFDITLSLQSSHKLNLLIKLTRPKQRRHHDARHNEASN